LTERRGKTALEPRHPEECLVYQDYPKTIEGVPRVSDVGIIEETAISITRPEARPYPDFNYCNTRLCQYFLIKICVQNKDGEFCHFSRYMFKVFE